MEINCVKVVELLLRESLLFTTKSLVVPGTHFIGLERMKCWVDLGGLGPCGFKPGTFGFEIFLFRDKYKQIKLYMKIKEIVSGHNHNVQFWPDFLKIISSSNPKTKTNESSSLSLTL